MKILSPSICFVICFIVLYQGSNALFRTEPLFRQNPKDRYYLEEQVNIHLKDTKPKLSPNVRAILINIATLTIRKIHAYNFSNFTDNSNQTLHSMRAISKEFGLSTKAVGGLAVLSLVGYGALSSFAPEIKNEISSSLSKEEKEGMHKLVTSCLAGMSDGLMRWVEDSVNELPSFPRLNAQECMKRSICEAHNKPRKYGLFGLALQLFFPPYIESKNEARVTSKYQLAAQHGRDNPNCSHYDDCLLSFMDLTRTLTNFLFQMSR